MAKKICRSAVALMAFCTCLTLMAPPASADWNHLASLPAGTLKIQGNGTSAQIPLTSAPAGTKCAAGVTLFEVTKPGAKKLLIRFSYFAQRFTLAGTTYVAVIESVDNSGTSGDVPNSITSDHNTVNSSIKLKVSFFNPQHANPSTSCETNGAAVCEWTAVHTVGLAWSASTPLTANRELAVSNPGGAAIMANPTAGCANAPFSPYAPPNGFQQFDNSPLLKIATSFLVNVKKGKISLTKTGMMTEVLDFNPIAAGNCTDGALGLALTGTTISSTSFMASGVKTFNGTTSPYLVVFTRSTVGNTAGSLNTTVTPHTVTNMRVAVVMTVYNTTDCTPTGTPICTLGVLLNLSGTLTGTTPGSELDLTGGSVGNVVAYPTCTAGPSHLLGSAGTVTGSIVAELP